MDNDELHAKLDDLALEIARDVRRSYSPAQAQQAIRNGLERAIQYDHELHSEQQEVPA